MAQVIAEFTVDCYFTWLGWMFELPVTPFDVFKYLSIFFQQFNHGFHFFDHAF
jgi:hypothetical protein